MRCVVGGATRWGAFGGRIAGWFTKGIGTVASGPVRHLLARCGHCGSQKSNGDGAPLHA